LYKKTGFADSKKRRLNSRVKIMNWKYFNTINKNSVRNQTHKIRVNKNNKKKQDYQEININNRTWNV